MTTGAEHGDPEEAGGTIKAFGVATVAAWLTEHNAAKGKPAVRPRDVTDWLHRYGPDRPPERLAVSPPYPVSAVEIRVAADRVIQGWTEDQRAAWEAWYDGRPGRGAGGGRRRKET